MRRKPLILLLLIVSLPMIGLAWLGMRVARDDEAALQLRFEEVFAVQLRDIDGNIRRHFESLATELRTTAGQVVVETDQIRALIRDQPKVRQIIVLDDEGMLLHPNPALPLNSGERDFLSEARELISDRDLIRAAALSEESAANPAQKTGPTAAFGTGSAATFSGSSEGTVEGWYAWYWGRGVHLNFLAATSGWKRRGDSCGTWPLDG